MKVITIAAPKGGSLKSTTTTLLAVRAVKDKSRVCMIDLNADQANLAQWWVLRGEPDNPHLEQNVTNVTRDVARLAKGQKYDFLFIDTPPLDMDLIENAVVVADCVLIPVRASIFDVGSIDAIVEMCRHHGKPYAFLLSAVDNRKGFKGLNLTAADALSEDGPVLSAQITYRLPYINALTVGKTGPEIDASLQEEVSALWSEVKAMLGRAKGARRQ